MSFCLNAFCRRSGGFLAALGILMTAVQPAHAIDPDRALSQYVHDRWGAEQGFPAGPVYAITQTSDGYLWIATEAGLVRFDGWNFHLMKDDSRTFAIASVLGLASDSTGCLWVRLQDLTIVRYCKGVFDRPSQDAERYTRIEAMSQTSGREMVAWKMEDGAFGFSGSHFRKLTSATGLPRTPALAVTTTLNGEVWVGTRDAALFRSKGGWTQAIRSGLPDLKINCLLPDGSGGVWIGTDNGIAHWNGSQFIPTGIPAADNHFQALALVRDRDANIWIGTDTRGLLRLNSKGVVSLPEGDTPGQAVTALFEDREGDLWVGHTDGIERLRDSAFVTYSVPEGLPTDGSNPVFVDSEDRMWFPPVNGGLWWMKDGKHGRVSRDGLDRDVVYSIDGKAGEVWIGRQRGGLTQLRSDGDSFVAKSYTQSDGLAENSVYSVYIARDGAVWAGTLSGGVSVLRNGHFQTYTVADGLASNTVASILEASDGTMWFATPAGLTALSNGRWHTFTVRNGLPSDNVNCLLQDSEGLLWAGTTSGPAFRSAQGFQIPHDMPSPLRETVLGLVEDRHGSIWMTTSSHVLRVNRDKLLHGSLGEGDLREFGLADGLRGMEGVKRHRSVVIDRHGHVWASLNRGISVVEPGRLNRDSVPPLVHVQSMVDDNRLVPVNRAVHIPGGHHRVTFVFTALGLSVPERVRYRYMLEGFDHGWSNPTSTREAVYTNLPPRAYRFRVMASNSEGVWSRQDASVMFDVKPLFWQTGWFVEGTILLCGLIGLGFYRVRLLQLTRRLNLRFEERLAERTRIAQELHDTLLQGFISASMQVHVAADSLPVESREKRILGRALELMGQVIEEGRNAVRGLRSSQSASLDLEQAFARIQQEFISQATGRQPEFVVIVGGEPKRLHAALRDEVYRIGREAVINAFRHAQANRIEVELMYSSRELRVFVRDNGRGIDPGVLKTGREGHWGLSGMRERADRIHARLHVRSGTAAGTEVELSIPGYMAFEDQPKRGWLHRNAAYPAGSPRLPGQNTRSK